MRTLLAESTPPQFIDEERLSRSEDGLVGIESDCGEHFDPIMPIGEAAENAPVGSDEQVPRIFPEAAVLASLHDLVEVGVDGIVMTTPGVLDAGGTVQALERGMAVSYRESFPEGVVSI